MVVRWVVAMAAKKVGKKAVSSAVTYVAKLVEKWVVWKAAKTAD